MKLPNTYGHLKKDLDFLEIALKETIQAKHPVLRQASIDLVNAGGKRIRPVFVLLAGKLGNYDADTINKAAVSLELIHMATLVHDDVIDEATLRRGKPTVKHTYGNKIAMYTGDYLLARALEVATTINNEKVHRVLSKSLVEVAIGEINQLENKFNWEQTLRDYLQRIKRKTALLIAVSCELGAIIGGLTDNQVKKLYRYGYYIGMSYQIIDDILDFTATSKQLGKPAGTDLLQGNITLPVLYAMQNEDFNKMTKDFFYKPQQVSEKDMRVYINRLKQTDAIERSYALSERYLEKALLTLEELPRSKSKTTLQTIAKYIGKRRI